MPDIIKREDSFRFLNELAGRKIRMPYGNTVRSIGFDPDSDSGSVGIYNPGDYVVRIGVQCLGGPDDPVRLSDLAWAARRTMHEARHLHQKEVLFRRDLSGRDLDMAVMSACAMAYTGYNDETYGYQLAEIDADLHGTKDAVSELGSAFPDIDWNMAMLEAYNDRNTACDSSRPDHGPVIAMTRAYIPGHAFCSMEEIYTQMEALSGKYLKALHADPVQEFCERDDRIYDKNCWDGRFCDLLWGDGSKFGRERDREILASVLQARVFDVQAYFPGMSGELEKIRSEYRIDSDAVRKLNYASYAASRGREPGTPDVPMF